VSESSVEPAADPLYAGMVVLDADSRRRLREHVEELAKAHEVEWRIAPEIPWIASEGDPEERWFRSPPIRTEIDYLTAIHEIGHVALGLPTFGLDGTTVIFENEEAVWLWALEHAILEHSNGASALIYGAFCSYEGHTAAFELRQRMRSVLESTRANAVPELTHPLAGR
jgi:hypothetical protein